MSGPLKRLESSPDETFTYQYNTITEAVRGLWNMKAGNGIAISWAGDVPTIAATGGASWGKLGKADADIAKGASGTVSEWAGTPGSEVDTGENFTAYNKFADVTSGSWVGMIWNGAAWYLIATECV